ncbi:hypothetical protein B5F90_06600 [Alistipes sp. An31A]|nr:hypothetical protein B5F90_06600 [Alistipes sp. An31A]
MLCPGFGPGAGERVGRPKRRPGQLGGRTVGWAAGRPNGRVKEWKGWQGRTEKDGNGKGPGPSGSRSVKGSFGQPLRSAKGLFRQGSGPSEPRPAGVPSRESRTPSSPDPPESRPVEGSFGPSPGQPKGCSVKVSARRGFVRSPSPGQQRAVPSRSRPVRGSARQRSGPPEPRPAGVPSRESRTPSSPDPPGSRPVKGSFGHPPPVSLRAVPSRSRLIRGSARQRSGPPEPRLAGVPPREGRPTPPRQGPHRTFSPFLPLHVLLLSSTAPAPLTPPTPRPSILRSGAAEPQGPRFDRRGWNRPSQDVERDFGCGAESCRRVGGSVAEASG